LLLILMQYCARAICLIAVLFTILLTVHFAKVHGQKNSGEYHALLIFSATGMLFMASAADLMVLYLGLELMALSIYVLVGLDCSEQRCCEAGNKIFFNGRFCFRLLLYGFSLLYGLTGATSLMK